MISKGLYTPAEAARLLHERTETVRRWAFGYTRVRGADRVDHDPLINTDLPVVDGTRAITFVELIELLYVRAFQRAGVSWSKIKHAARIAAIVHQTSHPFALRRLYVDPNSVYSSILEPDGQESIIQLVGAGQHTFSALVKPYLEQIEFGGDDVAMRWWPIGRVGGVVIDPKFAFGAPIVDEVAIRTQILHDAVRAEEKYHGEKALDRVAWLYEIKPKHVQSALRFEHWLNSTLVPTA